MDNGFGGLGVMVGGNDDAGAGIAGQVFQHRTPEGIDPRMGKVEIDEAGGSRRNFSASHTGSKTERLDPLCHDAFVTDRRRAPSGPCRGDDLAPECLRCRDAEFGEAAFRERRQEVCRPGETGGLQAERARIIEESKYGFIFLFLPGLRG